MTQDPDGFPSGVLSYLVTPQLIYSVSLFPDYWFSKSVKDAFASNWDSSAQPDLNTSVFPLSYLSIDC